LIRAAALLLTIATGFSGLVYEVAWQKYLATLLGAHSEATAAVLAIFLGGLAAGYALFGRVTRWRMEGAGPPRLLRVYGFVEAGIGVYAFAFPWLFSAAQRVSFQVPGGHELLGFGFDIVLTALLLLPPTILMGGTIPILTQGLARSVADSTRIHAFVYGFNTVGAFAGALAGGFWLVPWLGLDGVLYAMGAVNLGAGAVFVGLDALPGPGGAAAAAAVPAAAAAASPLRVETASYAAVAFLAGFAMMCVQTVLNRVGALSLGASHFTFAMVVAVFVLCIALGSFAVSALPRVPAWLVAGSQWLLVVLLAALYLPLQDAPYWAHALRALFRDLDAAFYPYFAGVFLATLAVLVVPIGLSGALLPLLFHHLRRELGELGGVAGRVYSWNTLGSLAGAVLGGYALLFWLDLHQVYRIAVGSLALGAALLSVRVLGVPRLAAGGAALAVCATLALGYGPWDPKRMAAGLFREREPRSDTFAGPGAFFARYEVRAKTLLHRDDPTATITVKEFERHRKGNLTRSVITNGKSDGNSEGDRPIMVLAGLVPALLAEKHERAFVVGFGLGVTAGELAALRDTREVEVAEISLGVIQAAPLFDFANHGASRNPKLRLSRGDAYRTLLRSQGPFDVIASVPSNPWVTGTEMLYSQEFLTAARDKLAPGGVYAQWIHLYETDERSVELVLRTYRAVFGHVAVWYAMGRDLLLLGFRSPERIPDVAALRRRFAQPDFHTAFESVDIPSFEALLSHEVLPLDVLSAAELPGPLHTLRHPRLSDVAARAFFRGASTEVPRLASAAGIEAGTRSSLLRRAAGLGGGGPPEELVLTLARETCTKGRPIECAGFLARGLRDRPGSEALTRVLSEARLTPSAAEVLSDANLDALVQLFGGPARAEARANSLQTARRLSESYFRFFNYAVPFDAEVLWAAWQRCREPEHIEDCRSGRARDRKRLGLDRVAAVGAGPGEAR
jgi:spermidine synthase